MLKETKAKSSETWWPPHAYYYYLSIVFDKILFSFNVPISLSAQIPIWNFEKKTA